MLGTVLNKPVLLHASAFKVSLVSGDEAVHWAPSLGLLGLVGYWLFASPTQPSISFSRTPPFGAEEASMREIEADDLHA